MTEILITDIQTKVQAKDILNFLKAKNPDLKINFDLNETDKAYPCGHTVLRIEGNKVETKSILTALHNSGYKCEILEDKVCL